MACFSSGVMKTQLQTSKAVLPQPWQISSNNVEQMPIHGESAFSSLTAISGFDVALGLLEFVIGIRNLEFGDLWSKYRF